MQSGGRPLSFRQALADEHAAASRDGAEHIAASVARRDGALTLVRVLHWLPASVLRARESVPHRPADARTGKQWSVVIHQDVRLFAGRLNVGDQVAHALAAGRKGWLQVVRGTVNMNGHDLDAGDGAAIDGEPSLNVSAKAEGSEILVFDLP